MSRDAREAEKTERLPHEAPEAAATGARLRRLLHPRCVVCGTDNPRGLGLTFAPLPDGQGVRAEFGCEPKFEGYEGVVHGGVVCALVDGAMANCLFAAGLAGRTARLTVRFSHPVRVGCPAVVSARLGAVRGRRREVTAEVVQNGCTAATGRATFLDERANVATHRHGEVP